MAGKVRYRESSEGDPGDPGWYVKCTDAWIGPYDDKAKADARATSLVLASCPHAHEVVPVGLQGDTASGKLEP